MKKLFLWLSALLLGASLVQATLPVIESTVNSDAFSRYVKRKGTASSSIVGDTLYVRAATIDTSAVYHVWPLTNATIIAAGDSSRCEVDVYAGLASTTTYGTMRRVLTITVTSSGVQDPVLLPLAGNPMCMFVVRPLPKVGNAVKVRILLSRAQNTGPAFQSASYTDSSTLNAPGAFPAVSTKGFKTVLFAARFKKFATSATLRPEGYFSMFNAWGPLDAANDTSVVADSSSVWFRVFEFPAGLDSIRQRFWSESGGTDTAVTSAIKLIQ